MSKSKRKAKPVVAKVVERFIRIPVRMTRVQSAVLAKKAAQCGVYLVRSGDAMLVPTHLGNALAYAARIRAIDAEIAA